MLTETLLFLNIFIVWNENYPSREKQNQDNAINGEKKATKYVRVDSNKNIIFYIYDKKQNGSLDSEKKKTKNGFVTSTHEIPRNHVAKNRKSFNDNNEIRPT